jgi:hypothetical protein
MGKGADRQFPLPERKYKPAADSRRLFLDCYDSICFPDTFGSAPASITSAIRSCDTIITLPPGPSELQLTQFVDPDLKNRNFPDATIEIQKRPVACNAQKNLTKKVHWDGSILESCAVV